MEIEQLTGVTVKEPFPRCVQFLEDVLNEPITARSTARTLQRQTPIQQISRFCSQNQFSKSARNCWLTPCRTCVCVCERERERERERQTDRQRERETDGRTDRQTGHVPKQWTYLKTTPCPVECVTEWRVRVHSKHPTGPVGLTPHMRHGTGHILPGSVNWAVCLAEYLLAYNNNNSKSKKSTQ